MLINPIKHLNTIHFGQEQKQLSVENYVAVGNDSFTPSKKVEPPVLTDAQIISNSFTDEQIKQINESRMLPENARFIPIRKRAGSGHYYLSGIDHYSIVLNSPLLKALQTPWINQNATRILPEGYEVKKSFLGHAYIVKVKES